MILNRNIKELKKELESFQKKDQENIINQSQTPTHTEVTSLDLEERANEKLMLEQISENIYNVTTSELKSLMEETIKSQKKSSREVNEPKQYNRASIDAICVRLIQSMPPGNGPLNLAKSYLQKTFRIQRHTKIKDLIKNSIKTWIPNEQVPLRFSSENISEKKNLRDNFELVNKFREPFRDKERTIEETLNSFKNDPAIVYVIPKEFGFRNSLTRTSLKLEKKRETESRKEETRKSKEISDFFTIFPRLSVFYFSY